MPRLNARRAFASAIAVAAMFLATPAPAQQRPPTLAELAMYDGPDRTKRLVEGAKKEGAVTIYSSVTVDDMKVLSAAFEKTYGVKLQAWRASSESILQRAMVEARGGRYEVDAIETSAAEMESLHRERLLQEVKSPHIADIVPAALRPHREWIGDRLNIISAAYNPNLVKKQDLPKSYDDLAHPKWKGCGFLRTSAELANMPGHPAIRIGAAHKKKFEGWLRAVFEAEGIAQALELARQILLLLDGSFAVVLLHRDPTYMETAGQVARSLVAAAMPVRRARVTPRSRRR